MSISIEALVIKLSEILQQRGWKLTTAESCTGGGIAYTLTSLPGSSAWFDRGFVTYSNSSKEECLGVNPVTLTTYGAVSEEIAHEMAEGALKHSQAQVSIAVTGIAGPDGGTSEKPVGTVWIAYAGVEKNTKSYLTTFAGNRLAVREQTIRIALEKLSQFLEP